MISDRGLKLRAWLDTDLPVLTEMRNDLSLQSLLLVRPRGSSTLNVKQWLEHRTADPHAVLLVIADEVTDACLGFVQITEIDFIDQRGELGICLRRSASGRGLGSQALSLLMPFLARVWRMRKLILRVRADNECALRCYERVGFQRCGLLREHTCIDGQWVDVILMEVRLSPQKPL